MGLGPTGPARLPGVAGPVDGPLVLRDRVKRKRSAAKGSILQRVVPRMLPPESSKTFKVAAPGT